MIDRRCATAAIGLIALAGTLLWACPAAAEPAAEPAATTATPPPDSLMVDLPDLVVRTAHTGSPTPDRTRLGPATIARHDPVTLADLGALLPSARVATNSRGDTHVMMRGAPERNVQTYLDGIPLNVPWDERVDLSSIPVAGIGGIEGRRGPTTLLDGPGALAGSVRILPPRPPAGTQFSRLDVGFGAQGRQQADALHQRRLGDWNLLGAGSWQRRDAFPLPHAHPAAKLRDDRFNSDERLSSLLLRASRPVAGTGRLSFLALGHTGSKGVPPELHLGQDARYWRYPVRERLILGSALDLPLDADEAWSLGATLSLDLFHQEIDPRGPDRWGAPLAAGDDYETNRDRTGFSRLRLTRWLGETASVAIQGSARYTHHRETLEAGGPELAYAQWLTSLVAEAEVLPGGGWTVRGGLGWDHQATPESGDKPGNPGIDAPALNLRVGRDLGAGTTVYAAASRRSRFPALREQYSGALGKFVPNPDLRPERQDMIEIGASRRGDRWRLAGSLFASWLTDGIEKQSLPGNRFQRVNRSSIRVPGLELIGGWTPAPHLDVQWQHTILAARVEAADGSWQPAEDRPDYQSLLSVSWLADAGPGALIEAVFVGPRWSAADEGLQRLSAGLTLNLRLSWTWPSTTGVDVGAHLRVDNVLDQLVDHQVGLPAPGRIVSGGVSVSL